MKQKTRKLLKDEGQKLQDSKAYQLATQMFKLGLGFVIAYPKAIMTSALIPPITKKLFNDEKDNKTTNIPIKDVNQISFKGSLGNELSKGMGKILDTNFVIKKANKLKDTNFAMHTIALTDSVSTLAFIHENNKNKKLKKTISKKEYFTMNQPIYTPNAPAAIGPYSQGFEVNGFVYTSGQIPVDPATGNVPEGIAAQAEQSCKNVGAILESAGVSFDRVFKTTCFLADMAVFAAFNAVYEQYFISKPARSCVEVARLPKDVLVEIECIAAE